MGAIKPLFKVDAALGVLFIGLIFTGIGLHVSPHEEIYRVWNGWDTAHTVIGILFLITGCWHIYGHRGWYKNLLKSGVKLKPVTPFLTLIFVFEVLTGLFLLFAQKFIFYELGHLHWIGGLLLIVFGSGHLIKRLSRLKKGLKL